MYEHKTIGKHTFCVHKYEKLKEIKSESEFLVPWLTMRTGKRNFICREVGYAFNICKMAAMTHNMNQSRFIFSNSVDKTYIRTRAHEYKKHLKKKKIADAGQDKST